MTERVVTCSSKLSDNIILRTRRRNYLIKVENFAKCSEKIAKVIFNFRYNMLKIRPYAIVISHAVETQTYFSSNYSFCLFLNAKSFFFYF